MLFAEPTQNISRMNLHQLRFVREAVRQNYNLTDAAKSLFTSQPGVSKAIIELEEELGVDIFTRHGKRIRGLTEPGRLVLQSVELIMQEIESLKRIGKEYAAHDSGSFTIATTHTQARYMLPKVVQAFMQKYPKVRLSLLQGNPKQIADMVKSDQADLAIATEAIATIDGLITLPATSGSTWWWPRPSTRCSSRGRSRSKKSPATRSSRMMPPSPDAARSTTRSACAA